MDDAPDPAPDPGPDASGPRGFEIGKDGVADLVVGYDGSDAARRALAFAVGLARRERAHLHVCMVGTLPALSGAAVGAAGQMVESFAGDVEPAPSWSRCCAG